MATLSKTSEEISYLKKKRLYIVGIVGFLILIFSMFAKYGFVQKWHLESEKAKIEDEISGQIIVRDSLRHVIKRLNTDMIEIERLARERYGMIRPGEEVLFVAPEEGKE